MEIEVIRGLEDHGRRIKRLETVEKGGIALDAYAFGFVTDYAGTQQTTIAFNDGTYVFTLAPTGTTWQYYRNGTKHTITGSKTVTLAGAPPAKGLYYIYIDATDGTLTASTVAWTLEDTKVEVATIAWDNALTPKYWMSDERHSCAVDRRWRWEHHFADGTEVITLPALTGYAVAPAVPSDTDNTFAVSQGVIADEDLKHILAALADPGGVNTDYVVFYRTAAAVWDWVASAMPYRYTAAGYIQYDNAGAMTQGQNNKVYNTYLLLTNESGAARFSIIHGQSEFATLALAQAETFASLVKTGININEFVAVYQLNWETSAAYGTKGKARLAATPREIFVSASGSSTPVSLPGGLVLLGDVTLAAAAASIDFSSIPSTYKHLQVEVSGRGDDAGLPAVDLYFRFNNDSGNNYQHQQNIAYDNTGVTQLGADGAAQGVIGRVPAGTATANYAGSLRLTVPDYAGTTFFKTAHGIGGYFSATTTFRCVSGSIHWRNTGAINRITILPSSGNFLTGTRITLYGLG